MPCIIVRMMYWKLGVWEGWHHFWISKLLPIEDDVKMVEILHPGRSHYGVVLQYQVSRHWLLRRA